jgi:hypothetical protein
MGCFLLLAGIAAAADLQLLLTSPKNQYLPDEPLFVTVTLSNVAIAEVAALRLLDPGDGVVSFQITAPGEERHNYCPWVRSAWTLDGLAETAIYLNPGAQYSASVDLTYEMRDGGRPTVLSQPGEYVIVASYAMPEGWPADRLAAWSNELRLLVTEPRGIDRAAYDLLQSGARTHDDGPWTLKEEQADCYETLLAKFPDSRYALPTLYYLAQLYDFKGTQILRGTPEAVEYLEEAAALYLSVAAAAVGGPPGLRATRAAARCFAKLGDVAAAQALLEEAFLSPAATDDDRVKALSRLGYLEEGGFERVSGIASATTPLALPLRRLAEALGFSLDWASPTKTVTVSSSRLRSTIRPLEDSVMVNGLRRIGVRTSLKDGRTLVSPSVIATLMAEPPSQEVRAPAPAER